MIDHTYWVLDMVLGGLSDVGRSNLREQNFILKKLVYDKYGVQVELLKKRWVYANNECTLNTAITVFVFNLNNI